MQSVQNLHVDKFSNAQPADIDTEAKQIS